MTKIKISFQNPKGSFHFDKMCLYCKSENFDRFLFLIDNTKEEMGMKWKRLLLTTLAVGILSSATAYAKTVSMNLFYQGKNHAYRAEEVKIEIDGEELIPADMPAVIIDGRTMLPMRLIAQELGCEVVWNEAAQQVYVINDEYTVVFTIDTYAGYQNGTEFTMDVPPMIVNDRTMLPVRALAKALELEITWDEATRTVAIMSDEEEEVIEPEEPEAPEESEELDIPTVSAGETITLSKVIVPTSESAGQVFTIQANGEIEDFEEVLLDDKKIVLDFYGAKSGLASKITKTNSSIVSAVRTAQHSAEDGAVYTRVVLDLNTAKAYEVTRSADGTKVLIAFEKVLVEDISFKHKNDKDIIEIEGSGALGADIFTLPNPNRIVIDIPNAESKLKEKLSVSSLEYVFAGRTAMFTDTTLRIVFEVGELTEYTYEEDDDSLTLEIHRSNLQNMTFDGEDTILYLEKDEKFDIDDVEIIDRYLDGYTEIILPEDLENVYGYGTYRIGGEVIESIEVSTDDDMTVIRFNQNRISVYEIEDEGDRYAIHILNPRDVYDKVLLLDAGHGGKDPGTSGNGLVEKDLNLILVEKIYDELKRTDITVYLTRDSDVYPENNQRAKTANDIAHAMVSIHMNAAGATINGTETLYQVHANDRRGLTSKKLAEIIQSSIISATGNTNRGTKLRTDLLILNGTTVPAVIVETVFLSNVGDALKISQSSYQDTVAEAIADAIEEAMDLI